MLDLEQDPCSNTHAKVYTVGGTEEEGDVPPRIFDPEFSLPLLRPPASLLDTTVGDVVGLIGRSRRQHQVVLYRLDRTLRM